eukprot:6205071-Pleurochrysis_carterae.AAC.2
MASIDTSSWQHRKRQVERERPKAATNLRVGRQVPHAFGRLDCSVKLSRQKWRRPEAAMKN